MRTLLVLLLLTSTALAAPPAGSDPSSPTAQWYRSLKSPYTGGSCCSEADCRPVVSRMAGDHYEAFIDRRTFGDEAPDDWLPVPDKRALHTSNPAGEAVACWYMREILCFVSGSAT